ncbi:transient receptor potential cation channel subfamily A member 1-like isoform X3 [Apostichopus japonicus]|uniref:transient receptor potential cation channel subfamily A member 1-like isoform X3 n=1 Tax=Stichopus japonicus TaxID=307972 RepID=UPI003AB18672
MKDKGWNRVLKSAWRLERRDERDTNNPPLDDLPLVDQKMRPKNKVTASPEKSLDHVSMEEVKRDLNNPARFITSKREINTIVSKSLPDFEQEVQESPCLVVSRDIRCATLLHHVAKLGKRDLVECLLRYQADINAVDVDNSTPLHWAVESDDPEIIDLLVAAGADIHHRNLPQMTPLHLACDMNKSRAVEALCKSPTCDVNVRGENGQVPVHYCAIKDSYEAAQKLIEFKPMLCFKDNYGVFPIHCAATNASRRVLDLLLTEAAKCGYTRAQLLSFTDKEQNTPLHAAVNGGCIDAIRVCLEFGAPLDVQSDTNCTPLHLACSQGALDIVTMMLKMKKSPKTLNMLDMDNMTPLHRAAMFDHVDIVDFMLDEGADMEALDNDQRTPLLLAASRSAWEATVTLVRRGADYKARDVDNKNVLHLAVRSGGNLDVIRKADIFERSDFLELLNEKDMYGCAPIHYATKGGNIKSVQGLIDLGATVNLRDNKKQSPLHFAARYGRYNSCKKLLDSVIGYKIINDSDNDGRTALHLAALNGHRKVVLLLISRGALIHRDFHGRSPLHLAASNGYTETMESILSTHSYLLDQTDDDGDTPLLGAARENQISSVKYLVGHGAAFTVNTNGEDIMDIIFANQNTEVAMAIISHDRWTEVLLPPKEENRTPIGRLIELMPDVFLKVLDRSLIKSEVDVRSPDYWYKYDFRYLQPSQDERLDEKKKATEDLSYLPALNVMVNFNRVDLLSHPVCVKYLEMKWKAYGFYVHMSNLLLYFVFLGLLTYFICTVNQDPSQTACNWTVYSQWPQKGCQTPSQRVALCVIAVFAFLNIIKEVFQIFSQGLRYFLEAVNYSEWVLYSSTLAFALPFLLPEGLLRLEWSFGAIAVFSAWYNLMLYLRRFDSVGIYIVMFMEIFKTLLHVILVFLVLIIAFAMAFYILMSQETNRAFSTAPMSILRVITMMAGELDFINSFLGPATDDDDSTLRFETLTFIFLIALILLLPILLMNLLIGLAVGDIATVQKDAQLKRLAMQVELHTDLEQKIPHWILRRIDRMSVTVYPNKVCGLDSGMASKSWMYLKKKAGLVGEDIGSHKLDTEHKKKMQEFDKMRVRVKKIAAQQEKQYELLKLIVQKMEIQTEADEQDEGDANPFMGKNGGTCLRPRLTQVVRDTLAKVAFKSMLPQRHTTYLGLDSSANSTPILLSARSSPESVRSNPPEPQV